MSEVRSAPTAPIAPMAPAFAVVYGRSGAGKTVDCGYAFPNALYVAQAGALQSIPAVCGYALRPEQITDAPDISAATKRIREAAGSGKWNAVVVDDFSLLSDRTFSKLERSQSGFRLWGALRDEVLDFRAAAREAGLHIVINAHEIAPRTDMKGRSISGGPKLSGDLAENFPVALDLVLRAEDCEDLRGLGHPVVYRAKGELGLNGELGSAEIPAPGVPAQRWTAKDRYNVTVDRVPMNLGEILRAAGYRLARPAAIEGIDPLVGHIATRILEVDPTGTNPKASREVLRAAKAHLVAQSIPNYGVWWALRDGQDRAFLRRTDPRKNRDRLFGL